MDVNKEREVDGSMEDWSYLVLRSVISILILAIAVPTAAAGFKSGFKARDFNLS